MDDMYEKHKVVKQAIFLTAIIIMFTTFVANIVHAEIKNAATDSMWDKEVSYMQAEAQVIVNMDDPIVYVPDETEVEMLAQLLWGEARGVPSDTEKSAVVWCVLNRVDADAFPNTVAEVVAQPHQFNGYSPRNPIAQDLKVIAADVLVQWEREKKDCGDVERMLPCEYLFFTGDGKRNFFRKEYRSREYWDWVKLAGWEAGASD